MPDGALRTIEVRLSIVDNLLMVAADLPINCVVGSQYDHNAQRLLFARPDGYDELNLWLHFRDGLGTETSVDIGRGSEYLLPNSLTQTTGLRLQVAFQEGDVFRESANILLLRFHSAIRGGSVPPNMPGNPSVPQDGDGGNGTSATFQIVQTNTGAAGSNATTAEAYNSTPSDRRYILTIPRGADGKDGRDGEDGEPGLPGRDGADGHDGDPGPNQISTATTVIGIADGKYLGVQNGVVAPMDVPSGDSGNSNDPVAAADVIVSDTASFPSGHVEGALQQLFQSGSSGKAALAAAIEDMGGEMVYSSIPSFSELETGIRSIPSDSGDDDGDDGGTGVDGGGQTQTGVIIEPLLDYSTRLGESVIAGVTIFGGVDEHGRYYMNLNGTSTGNINHTFVNNNGMILEPGYLYIINTGYPVMDASIINSSVRIVAVTKNNSGGANSTVYANPNTGYAAIFAGASTLVQFYVQITSGVVFDDVTIYPLFSRVNYMSIVSSGR